MTPLRVTLGVIGAAAAAASLLIGRPAVFFPLALLGIVAFVVAAGCLAAGRARLGTCPKGQMEAFSPRRGDSRPRRSPPA